LALRTGNVAIKSFDACNFCRSGQIPLIFTVRKKIRHISVFLISLKLRHYFDNILLYQAVDLYFKWKLSIGISIAFPEKHGCPRKSGLLKISEKR